MALSAPAVSATPIVKKGHVRGAAPPLVCAVQIDFGSAASGPDIDTWATIRSYINQSTEIDEADAWGWGREGEFSVCLTIHDTVITAKVLADLTNLVPTSPAKNGGWTKVKLGAAKS